MGFPCLLHGYKLWSLTLIKMEANKGNGFGSHLPLRLRYLYNKLNEDKNQVPMDEALNILCKENSAHFSESIITDQRKSKYRTNKQNNG